MENQNLTEEDLFQGVLLYRGNRLVRRLQSKLGMVAEILRIVKESETSLGKRPTSERYPGLFKSNGIVSLYSHVCETSLEKMVSDLQR